MRRFKVTLLFVSIIVTWTCAARLGADTPASPAVRLLFERLQQTRAVNIDAVIETQFGTAGRADGFSVADPYGPAASATVRRWQSETSHETAVCALRFTGKEKVEYELRGFETPAEAVAEGFTVTHQGRCGSCSTLKDLAVYLATPDLTTPARQCARRFGMSGKQRCFEEVVGFTPYCAESWAYNAHQTKQECLGVCVSDYGFFNLLFRRYPGDNVDDSGQLRPCLKCDEDKSGPGFKYSAGRTRRNSGIASAIPRPGSEIYPLDHSAYFH
jgi:hypothetical protein